MAQSILELKNKPSTVPTKEEFEKALKVLEISKRIFDKVEFYRAKHAADENK